MVSVNPYPQFVMTNKTTKCSGILVLHLFVPILTIVRIAMYAHSSAFIMGFN